MQAIGLLILRLGLGGYMLTHGIGKLQMIIEGRLDQFGDPIGLGPELSLIAVTGAEFLCAILVIFGAGTRFAALPIVFTMGVAAFVVHGDDPWTMMSAVKAFRSGASESFSSKELALVYLIGFLALAFTGAGRFSVDAFMAKKSQERRDAAGRL